MQKNACGISTGVFYSKEYVLAYDNLGNSIGGLDYVDALAYRYGSHSIAFTGKDSLAIDRRHGDGFAFGSARLKQSRSYSGKYGIV